MSEVPLGLPADLLDRARALAEGTLTPPEARDAATVILLRDGAAGVEVYLLRRVASMAFAPGMTVFPGGSVDERDAHLPDAYWSGPTPSEWAERLRSGDDLARALVCAAVRETFEESGVLLAGTSANDVVADTRGEDWEADRAALVDRSLSFAAFLERRGLVLRTDLLHAWQHWITPEFENRRYDTRFFVAELPAGQRTRDVGGEADRVAWMRPDDALARAERGEHVLLPPTLSALRELSTYAAVRDVVGVAHERVIEVVLPKVVLDPTPDGEATLRFLLPGDSDYPE